MRLGQHLGVGVPVESGGKSWIVGPITLDEFAEFNEFLLRKRLEDAANFCADRPECRDVMMREAMREVKELKEQASREEDFGGMITAFQDISNLRELLYICIKKNHPEVTREEASKVVTLVNMSDVLVSVMEASGLDGGSDPTNPGLPKEGESKKRSESSPTDPTAS